MDKFAERLKILRINEKLTLLELAAETGLSYSALRQWEKGMRSANHNAIIVLANFFGVTTDYLLGLED